MEYAADLPVDQYGSGFPTQGEYKDHPWVLSNLKNQPGSLVNFIENGDSSQNISGITLPWAYMGMMYATFCWHFEDLMTLSINYMHTGGSKVWYGVPASDRKKFERVTKSKLAALHDNDTNFLMDITL